MRKIVFTLSLALTLALCLATPTWAQDGDDDKPRVDRPRSGGYSLRMPNWTIRPEIKRLENQLDNYNELISGLGKANQSLKKELQEYLNTKQDDPRRELLASRIERKMAIYAGRVLKDFNSIIAGQDEMIANFNSLKRKLKKYHTHLSYKERLLKDKLADIKKQKRTTAKDLKKLAIKIRNLPKDSAERKLLMREFNRKHYKYRLQNRYFTGYNRNHRNYQILTQNLKTLVRVFGTLDGKFRDLVSNLELEKKFLIDNIKLQVDNLMVKKLIREGITHGKHAIKNVTEKMSRIYLKVDAFNKVHDRINQGLTNFSKSQKVLIDASKQIDSVGTTGKGGVMNSDDLLKKFANMKFDEFEGDNNAKSDK